MCAGAPRPDVGTVEAFKRALPSAHTVAVPASTSGIYLTRYLFPRLGISEKIDVKVTPRGTGAAAMVAAREAKLAVMPVSEIPAAPGVDFAGPIPREIQLVQMFSAAVVAGSAETEAGKRLIAFLGSEHAAAAIGKTGMVSALAIGK